MASQGFTNNELSGETSHENPIATPQRNLEPQSAERLQVGQPMPTGLVMVGAASAWPGRRLSRTLDLTLSCLAWLNLAGPDWATGGCDLHWKPMVIGSWLPQNEYAGQVEPIPVVASWARSRGGLVHEPQGQIPRLSRPTSLQQGQMRG